MIFKSTPDRPGLYLAVFSQNGDLLSGWENNLVLFRVEEDGRIRHTLGLSPLPEHTIYVRLQLPYIREAVDLVNARLLEHARADLAEDPLGDKERNLPPLLRAKLQS